MHRIARSVLLSVGLAALLVGMTGGVAGAALDTNRKPQVLIEVGSDATYEGNNDLAQLYNESPGCATIPPTGTSFTNYGHTCISGGTQTYDGTLIETENLYHDMVVPAYPVGSSNGRLTFTQTLGGNAAAIDAAFARSSSKQTYGVVAGFDIYGTAYMRDALGVWVGRNNTHVYSPGTTAIPDFKNGDLNDVWIGNGSGTPCRINWAASATDSLGAAHGLPDTGTIDVFATQTGSGTGKDWATFISGVSQSNAAPLANCIKATHKDGNTANGERVIFENNATPICHQGVENTSFSATAIFPYGLGRFTQNQAATGSCAGVLGKVDGVKPGPTTIGVGGTYLYSRYVYEYFAIPSPAPGGFNIDDPATWNLLTDRQEAVLNYLHPVHGWLCKVAADHSASPTFGKNYRTLISNTMKADGFAPIGPGLVGGTTFTGTSHCRDAASV